MQKSVKNKELFILYFILITIFVVGLFLGAGSIWNWYRANYLACHTLPQTGETRCYRNEAEWIHALSGGQITVVPDDIHLINAYATYNDWASTHNAATRAYFATQGTTVTPIPPTPWPDGSTQDPTQMTQIVQTFEHTIMLTWGIPTPTMAEPTEVSPSPSD